MPLPEDITELAAEVSNWGRWGDDDELGCGNLLTAETARRGTDAVRDGLGSGAECVVVVHSEVAAHRG